MADQANEKPEAAAPVADAQDASAVETKSTEPAAEETAAKADGETKEDTKSNDGPETAENAEKTTENDAEKPKEDEEKPAADGGDAEVKDGTEAQGTEEAAGESSAPPAESETAPASASVETPASKAKARRKSTAGEPKGKTLNRKNSKARITHLDAKPGDHFLVKLKGYPAWPCIICDESMLPYSLVNNRPVTAARPDGTYAEAYADGGKRAHDRSFPVMYLYTNEFGWVSNTALTQLSVEKAGESITDKMRKDLREAYLLAAENNPIEHYKEILNKFQEELNALEEAAKEAAITPKKTKKGKAKAVDEDVEMADVADAEEKPKSSKKRKASEDVGTPQRSDSVKKPKIKLTTSTPKANGTPKAKDESATKAKTKTKKASDKKAEAPKESKLTPEERRSRKEKEVLYLRHKLQRGLLTRDQQPQESEMKQMSEYIQMLENFHELEVSIIRATKINKVLKAILKLESIPREEEFHFKERSQVLLEKWNKLLAADTGAPAATNGINGKSEDKKSNANGVKEEAKKDEPAKAEKPEPKSEAADGEEQKPSADEATAPPEIVEAAA